MTQEDVLAGPVTRNLVRCSYTMTSLPVSWRDIQGDTLRVGHAPARGRLRGGRVR